MREQTYEEWLLTAGAGYTLGAKMLVSFSMLRDLHREHTDILFRPLKDAFDRALFEKGYRPHSIELSTENDISMRAKELIVFLEATQGSKPEEFLPVLYKQASGFFDEVQRWKNKSLWQYLKYWAKRTWEKCIG